MTKTNKKLLCEKHNIPLTIIETSDGYSSYVCEICTMEKYI